METFSKNSELDVNEEVFPKIIKLNVGGLKYTTTLTTLRKFPHSMLGCMFAGNFAAFSNDDGEYFVDANGEMFKYILDFLRREKLLLPDDFKEFDLLTGEADFYQIEPLIVQINELRDQRKPKEVRTLLYIWVECLDMVALQNGEGLEYDRLYAVFIKSKQTGLFEKFVQEEPTHCKKDDMEGILKKEGYIMDKESESFNYNKLLLHLYPLGVTSIPKHEAHSIEAMSDWDGTPEGLEERYNEPGSYKYQLWRIVYNC